MKTMLPNVLIFAISLIMCAGCSVKEDRSICPCRLELDFSEVDTAVVLSADLDVTASDSFVCNAQVQASDFRYGYMLDVPKGLVRIAVWYGRGEYAVEDGVRIPYGSEAPLVYLHYSEVDADCESLREQVMMRKNYCKVLIRMKGEDAAEVGISLLGNVDGYMRDGKPSSGPFRSEAVEEMDEGRSVVIPRQIDNSLIMELDDGSGVLKRFALGEYIAESGYDWKAPDLEDIVIDLDFAVTHLTLVIQGWEKEYSFDIVI